MSASQYTDQAIAKKEKEVEDGKAMIKSAMDELSSLPKDLPGYQKLKEQIGQMRGAVGMAELKLQSLKINAAVNRPIHR